MMMRSVLFTMLVLLTGCGSSVTPSCPYADDDSPVEVNAGCLITREDQILFVEQRITGRINLPGGTAKDGESARCTAWRETHEETGAQVVVTRPVMEFKHYIVYQCSLLNPLRSDGVDLIEIQGLHWLDKRHFDQFEWRFPYQQQYLTHYLDTQTAQASGSIR